MGPSSFPIAAEGIFEAHFYCKMAFLSKKKKEEEKRKKREKKGMRRRGEDVWIIRNGNGRCGKQECSSEERVGVSELLKEVQRGREGNRRRKEERKSEMEKSHRRRDRAETSSEAPLAVALVSFLCGS